MTRAVRFLALVTIAVSLVTIADDVVLEFYPRAISIAGLFLTSFLSQQLRATNTALGLTLAIVELVATAQARHWRWFSVFLLLALVTTYMPGIVGLSTDIFLGVLHVGVQLPFLLVLWPWLALSYSVPAIATALLALAEESRTRISRTAPGPTGNVADNLRTTPPTG
ncbi:MAG: hypothetical protein ACLQUY_16365 [Ktedonobacterales bacterium]